MESNNYQRGIRSRSYRSSGDAPDLGRITRMRDVVSPRGTGQRRTRRRGGGRGNGIGNKWTLGWSILMAALVLLVIAGALFFWLQVRAGRDGAMNAGMAIDPDLKVRVASRFPSPSEEQALGLVKRALFNRDPSRVAEFVRMGEANPAEVIDFFVAEEAREGPPRSFSWLGSVDSGHLLVDAVHVAFEGPGKPLERLALLTPDPRGVWKLDFEAYARKMKPSWSELLECDVEQALVRGIVAADDYYNGPFRDDKAWSCYAIVSPDSEHILHGYCKVESAEERAMKELFIDGSRTCRATLEIRRVEAGKSRQFEISRVLAKDWVIADPR